MIRGWLGCTADNASLMMYSGRLCVIPMGDILRLVVDRVLPAKGLGGAWLNVVCRCTYDRKMEKSIAVCTGMRADDLNEIAVRLARATGKPLTLSEYSYDC